MSRKMYRHTHRPASRIVRGESKVARMMDKNRLRLVMVMACFACSFAMLALRLFEVGLVGSGGLPFKRLVSEPHLMLQVEERKDGPVVLEDRALIRRPIVDRNGMILAANIRSAALVANPTLIKDKPYVARKLSRTLKNVSYKKILSRINKPGSKFAYLKRHLSPTEQEQVNALGIPGLYFEKQTKRTYPFGKTFAHVLGYVNIDNHGLAGVEKQFDSALFDPREQGEPLQLSLDARVQSIVHEEVASVMRRYDAKGAAAVVVDVDTGEVVALSSLPSFDPHKAGDAEPQEKFNRATYGVYEMGSTFKTFTMAMGLEKGVISLNDGYDVSKPIRVAGYTINDHHPKGDWLSVPEIFAYSSNVGTVKIMMDVGADYQKEFLKKIGMNEPVELELPEMASPLLPQEWRDINMMTISYGHGMSVTPMHLVKGIVSMVNGGHEAKLSLMKRNGDESPKRERLIKEMTSHNIRTLMRFVVQHGTAKTAEAAGYRVGGKTGTAEKIKNGRYKGQSKLTSFVSVFPVDQPKYVIYVMVDEPQPITKYEVVTGGSVAAPAVSNIISRIGPMMAVRPVFDGSEENEKDLWLAAQRGGAMKHRARKRAGAYHAIAY